MKKLAGEDENEHEKFAPKVFNFLMEELLMEQTQYKTKLVEMIATCPEQDAIYGLLKNFDFKTENSENDGFDKNSQSDELLEAAKDEMDCGEDALETFWKKK